jgi:precorrin-6A/cobalt-precorrin-6A reductase
VKTVLLLAGTAEARRLAAECGPEVRLIASLAGVTDAPCDYPCDVRTGGFGGVSGMRAFIEAEHVAAVVDATHPFATVISSNAIAACEHSGTPSIRLVRPAWEPVGDWHGFAGMADAVAALPAGARVLATTGRKETGALESRTDIRIILRSVDPPGALPPHLRSVTARGPFTLESEVASMRKDGITHLLTRNAGGESRARIDAAVALGIALYIVERPVIAAANSVSNVADALDWLRRVLRD